MLHFNTLSIKKIFLSIIVLMFMTSLGNLSAQGIKDSIFVLKGVEIVADRVFIKEESGMKETKIDSIVMKEKINVSLADLLSENTPVFIKTHGRGALSTASFRGTAASHTQVTWNGLNINSPMTGMVDFSLIPVYIIDDISLKHGTASIADNSGGLGGSINVGNVVDVDSGFNVKYLQGLGSYHTYNEFLQLGYGHGKLHLKTRLYDSYSKNDYTFINHGIVNINPTTGVYDSPLDTNDNASYHVYGLLQEMYYRLNNNNIISAKYWGQKSNRTIPQATSYEGPDNSNLNRQIDSENKIIIDWTHYANRSILTVKSGYTDEYLIYTLRNYVAGAGLIPAIYSESKIKSIINNADYKYDINEGLSIECNLNANIYDVWSQDSVKHTGYDVNRQEFSGYVSINENLFDILNISLKMRQDYVDGSFSPFIPYLGFDLKILKNQDLFLKGNIARNYHKPSLNDLYWQPGGNKDLLPEKGYGMELGLEYQYVKDNYSKVKTSVTTYYNDINDWIIWVPSYRGYWQPMNIKHVISKGIEAEILYEQKIGHVKLRLTGNYSYTSAKNYGDSLVWGSGSYGKQLVYIPLHSANMLINISYKGYYITYQNNSYSERYTTSSNDVTRRDRLYPYYMNDIFIGKDFTFNKINISVEFKIYNLFDEEYHTVLYRPMPRRNYLFQIVFGYK